MGFSYHNETFKLKCHETLHVVSVKSSRGILFNKNNSSLRDINRIDGFRADCFTHTLKERIETKYSGWG